MAGEDASVRLTGGTFEQTRLVALRNTDAGIADLDFNLDLITLSSVSQPDVNITAFGELDGVADQDWLLPAAAQRIANNVIRHVVLMLSVSSSPCRGRECASKVTTSSSDCAAGTGIPRISELLHRLQV